MRKSLGATQTLLERNAVCAFRETLFLPEIGHGDEGEPSLFQSPFTKLSYNLFIYFVFFSPVESFPNDLINDTLARLSMRLKILFEEDYVKMLEKKRKRRSQNRKWHFPRSVYFRKKMVGYRTRCEEREKGGVSLSREDKILLPART